MILSSFLYVDSGNFTMAFCANCHEYRLKTARLSKMHQNGCHKANYYLLHCNTEIVWSISASNDNCDIKIGRDRYHISPFTNIIQHLYPKTAPASWTTRKSAGWSSLFTKLQCDNARQWQYTYQMYHWLQMNCDETKNYDHQKKVCNCPTNQRRLAHYTMQHHHQNPTG